MTKRSLLLILCCIAGVQYFAQAAHIIGGDVIYRCVSSDEVAKTTTFRVSFTMYRDVLGGGANYDLNAQFGVYRSSPNSPNWFFVESIVSNPTNIGNIPLNDPCVSVPPNIRVERGSYHFNVTIPWDGNKYQITYQRCCRNNTINNIINPASTGAVFTIELEPQAIRNCNNSPSFKKFPPIIVCNNRPLQFDHGATDMEADSVVFEFCTPLTSGGMEPGDNCTSIVPSPFKCPPPYQEVTFIPPYTSLTPMGGNPVVQIDGATGLITGSPNLVGQYVVGICMKEYRNGQLYTTTRRDFQFNVLDCIGITFNQNYNLCDNDSLVINEVVYTEAGTYAQNFITESGCDSIVVLTIKEIPSSLTERDVTICAPETYDFLGEILSTSGTYTKTFQNSSGCDSTLIVRLVVNQPTEDSLHFSICDDEFLEINGNTYNESGVYQQILTNANGCDSTLTIIVQKGVTFRDTGHYYLCISPSFVINGITYDQPGEYQQNMGTQSGCDSTLVIKIYPCEQNLVYDFETCNALTPEQSMNYAEFLPKYESALSCGGVDASNIFREFPQENKHSCTEGQESSLSMCVSAFTGCNVTEATQKPVVVTFLADPAEGSYLKWNHLIFHHRSPAQYSWINGASGLNNGPTKFRYIIYKNGQSVLVNNSISTGDAWGRIQVNFLELPDMQLKKGDSIRIEWLPYCAIGNNSNVSVWDMDNISLYFSCETKTNRIVGGTIQPLPNNELTATIKRKDGHAVIQTSAVEGRFVFRQNDVFSSYEFSGYHDENVADGISGLDLVLIQKHILGLTPFVHPMQFVAADVNRDAKINSLDLIELRKIILGIREEFSNNTSWRLIPESVAKSGVHPFFWQDKVRLELGYHDLYDLNFIPVKIGDVDGSPVVSGLKVVE